MGLFPKLNKRKTIKNVKDYFEKDFPRLKARSHMDLSSLQSPQFDTIPNTGNVRNNQEDNVISGIDAQEFVKSTYDVINKAPRIYKIILKNVYLLDQGNSVAMELTGYETSQYAKYKNRSLLYFADTYQDIYDLNDYSECTNDLKSV
ncbi:hypothetical protein D1B17_03750 [Companilactobacillus zhachilii]|uniref:ArpU family transcriptional regulator n=1 Tax=Companilactobacillus zhachilii TaxID=2304606 RepID=A0A386PR30_9LACO|nr:ArpU family phage packaging/lysis transcriptional regulator [Companilactobacillus zhachilii]AYE37792.1 hypothetical protein D1B17_03750 [Companilactobacillus zhachilii]